MGLESANFIGNLIEDWPTADDFRREGDDHFRMLKGAIKRTFPNATAAYTLTPNQANNLIEYIKAVETNARSMGMPAGTIVLWSGAANAVPAGWALCNGTQGTPDLRGRFVLGASTGDPAVDETGGLQVAETSAVAGAPSITEEHALTVQQMPEHKHGLLGSVDGGERDARPLARSDSKGVSGYTGGGEPVFQHHDVAPANGKDFISTEGLGQPHLHSIDNAPHTHLVDVVPPYYALAYIMKLETPDVVTPPAA